MANKSSDFDQKIKLDVDHFLINFSDGYIECQLCGSRSSIPGRNFGIGNREEICDFKEKHKTC
ncbi:MAG TPA: hypothetical protein PKH94_03645 [Bacteroidales bacterium]|nr:hypothetical protein [Bacteroidales bacterium]HNS46308.1 hypothetical protein [Bacteroidales bacterium]